LTRPGRPGLLRAALASIAVALALSSAGCGDDEEPAGPGSDLPRAGDEGTRFGYSEAFVAGTGEIELLGRSGADFARRRLSWTEIEGSPGAYDWSRYDAIYDELLAEGLRPLWFLVDAPCWARLPDPACVPNAPARAPSVDHADAVGAFLAEAAKRYPEALGIEVGNEVNDDRFWAGGLNPNDYAYILGVAADAIHEADPDMPVVASGFAPFEKPGPGRLPWPDYVRAMINSGAAEKVDALAFHPYAPGNALQAAESVIAEQESFEAYVDSKGLGDIPVWVTEIGVTTVGPEARTPEQQAAELTGILTGLEERGTPVVAFHRLQDEVIPGDELEAGFGVIAADGVTPKPAFCAIAALRDEPC
jgi:hypothetical protein